MDDYFFKARLSWSKGIDRLSDPEAGRLMKALWAYAGSGERQELTGREDLIFNMIIGDLEEDAKTRTELSDKRREAANARWHANDANAQSAMQEHANDAIKNNRYINRYNKSHIQNQNAGMQMHAVKNPAQDFTQRKYEDETSKNIAEIMAFSEENGFGTKRPIKEKKNPACNFTQRPYSDDMSEMDALMAAEEE